MRLSSLIYNILSINKQKYTDVFALVFLIQEQFPAGQLIWGKLKGFDWWPGIVVHLNNLTQTDNQFDEVWVKWYGDNKFSKVLERLK